MTHGTFNARNYDAGILTHGILTQGGIWRRDTRGDFWRTEFWRIYVFNDFWRTEFWRRWILTHFFGGWFLTHLFEGWFLTHFWGVIFDAFQFCAWHLTHFFGGWFLTHFSFVHVIWRNFWGVNWSTVFFRLNTFCMHFNLVCFSVYVKFKVYATCFWTSFSCLGTAFPVFKHHFPVSEWPFLL